MSAPGVAARALVTGASGFVATHAISALRERGVAEVYGIARTSASGLDGYAAIDLASASAAGELRDCLSRWQPEWVLHLAGGIGASSAETLTMNAVAAATVLEAVSQVRPDASVVVLGSAAEYGRVDSPTPVTETHPCEPESAYGIAKHAQTLLALAQARRGMCVAVARAFNLIGAGVPGWLLPGALLARASEASARGEGVVRLGNVQARRDFLAVEDAVRGIVDIVAARLPGEVFNLASGQAIPVSEIVGTLLSFFPERLRYETDPAFVRASDPPVVIGDATKARERLGWVPQVPIAMSLRAAYDHARASAA